MGSIEKKKRRMSLTQKERWVGYVFLVPWLIGIVGIFIRPMLESFIYAFSDVKLSTSGIQTFFCGLSNFKTALLVDPDYNKALVNSVFDMVYNIPVIVMFSIFIAGILNQKFFGRGFARVLFFMPVIIASGAVLSILKQSGMMLNFEGTDTVYMLQSSAFEGILQTIGLPKAMLDFVTQIANHIFDITWKSSIQIILYLAALQTIPRSYYEVASLEGATAWEVFWKITFPVFSPITLVVVVYTIVDSFTNYENGVMSLIDKSFKSFKYGLSAAESWLYFVIILLIIAFITKTIFKRVVYIDE